MRNALVTALVACTDVPLRNGTRRFLAGLSKDELEFIAEFLGACILDAPGWCVRTRAELAERIAWFERARLRQARRNRADQEHKMILLLEYLCHSGIPATAPHAVN